MNLGIDNPQAAIVAIDLHRGHLDPDVATMPLERQAAERVVAANRRLFGAARAAGLPIVHLVTRYRDAHEIRANPFWRTRAENPDNPRRNVLKHNLMGLPGCTIMPGLYEARDVVVDTKKRYDCFVGTDLDFVLRASRVCTVLVLPCSLYRYRQSPVSTRIASDQTRVENAIDRRYRALSRLRATNSYDDVLQGASSDETKRVDPRVFVSLGSLALWSQGRPRVLRRFLHRARFRFDLATAISAVWVSWASLSPGTLRSVMNLASSLRGLDPRRHVSIDEPVEWLRPDGRRDRG